MKIINRIVLLTAVLLVVQAANAQVNNPDTMIRKIFSTLQAKDQKAFVALYPNGAQFGKMMRTMMEQMLNSEQMKQMMAMDEKSKNMNIDSLINAEVAKMSTPEAFAEMQKSFVQSFQKIIEKGESKGVKWSDARLVTYTKDTAANITGDMAMLQATGIKNMKGVIDFRSNNTDYQMSFDKVIYLPSEGGWFGGEFPQLARKGESLEPDKAANDKGMSDTFSAEEGAITTDTTVSDSPKAKEKTKTKTKSGDVKTKTKTKSSARKTTGTKS
jgi:hypothetical protein